MDLLDNLALGLEAALQWENILFCFIGVALGTAVGVLPGIGPTATVAMLLPITFSFDDPVSVALNNRPKYVVSTTLTDPRWAGTTVLSGDVAAAIRDLKSRQDGELVVPGSGVLVRWLLANDLVDQLDLLTYPVVVGQGTRLFPDTGPDRALDLIASRTTSGGITIQTWRLAGRPEYATGETDSST